ncbi:MAG: RNA-binding S4 domain-containing protein [Rhodomicrobiaceae bacterium]
MTDLDGGKQNQRLDKWLWHARIVKTRSLASQLVGKGKFRVNRERIVKPAHMVKCGDVITASLFGRVRIFQIAGFSERRGPAGEARALYVDMTPPEPEAPEGEPAPPPDPFFRRRRPSRKRQSDA